jgi:hypothetical protein
MITVMSTSPGLGTGMLSTEEMSVQYDPNDPEVPAGEEQDQVRGGGGTSSGGPSCNCL